MPPMGVSRRAAAVLAGALAIVQCVGLPVSTALAHAELVSTDLPGQGLPVDCHRR